MAERAAGKDEREEKESPLVRARRLLPALVALLAVAVLASACQAKSAFKVVGQNDINPVPRSTLQDGGTLNWPISALPINYNFNGEAGETPHRPGNTKGPMAQPVLLGTIPPPSSQHHNREFHGISQPPTHQ